MLPIVIEYLPHIPVGQQQMELVERKGLGHPDSMCDAMMEAISVALCRTLPRRDRPGVAPQYGQRIARGGPDYPGAGRWYGGGTHAPHRR